jgi:hypothetical protein
MKNAVVLLLVCFCVAAAPASARITRSRPAPTQTWSPLTPITIGSSFEYESNDEGNEFHLPAFFEYNFTERFRANLEIEFARTHSNVDPEVPRAEGLGDLETAVDYEFLRERRYSPALTATVFARWPTATDEDVGEPGTDYGLGITASKDFIYFDLDLEVRHAFATSPELGDSTEVSLSGESRLSRRFDLIAEVVKVLADEDEFESTVGLAWHPSKFLTIESGVTRKNDGTNQFILAWEYSFAGED